MSIEGGSISLNLEEQGHMKVATPRSSSSSSASTEKDTRPPAPQASSVDQFVDAYSASRDAESKQAGSSLSDLLVEIPLGNSAPVAPAANLGAPAPAPPTQVFFAQPPAAQGLEGEMDFCPSSGLLMSHRLRTGLMAATGATAVVGGVSALAASAFSASDLAVSIGIMALTALIGCALVRWMTTSDKVT